VSASHAAVTKARAEVETLVDELVQTIEHGVVHPDDRPGFRTPEAVQLRADLRDYADATLAAARRTGGRNAIQASVHASVDTIRRGVIHPEDGPGFGSAQAEELSRGLLGFADAIVEGAAEEGGAEIDASIERVVRSIRRGLFRVYGRASYAAISGDQLAAYLQTFVDAVRTVLETDEAAGEPEGDGPPDGDRAADGGLSRSEGRRPAP
jgi:hypothetical protein